jgi:hypothetical protein
MDITRRIDDPDLLKFNELVKNHRWREILHSVKLHSNKINKNRILYGINSSSIRYRDIVNILTELKFPFDKFPTLEAQYYESYDLGVGLEKSSSGELNYRIYFEKNYTTPEMRKTIERMLETNNEHLFPIITGIKWNIDAPEKAVVTDYQSMVNYTGKDLIKRMTDQGAYVPARIKTRMLAAPDGLFISKNYRPLEVYETATSRKSFDIGFEKKTFYTQDLCDSEMNIKFGRNLEESLAEFNLVSIGHVATGKDKYGEDFLTIYYVVHG